MLEDSSQQDLSFYFSLVVQMELMNFIYRSICILHERIFKRKLSKNRLDIYTFSCQVYQLLLNQVHIRSFVKNQWQLRFDLLTWVKESLYLSWSWENWNWLMFLLLKCLVSSPRVYNYELVYLWSLWKSDIETF